MVKYIWQEKAWPNFTWDNDKLIHSLSRCNFKRGQLLGRMASLGVGLNLEAQAEVLAAEVLQTSAIEGQILNPASVRSSVARRLGLPDGGLTSSDRYTDGLVDVLLDATGNYSQPLTKDRLHGWQAAFFPTGYSGLHRIIVGDFRGNRPMQVISGAIGKERIHYEAPPSNQVDHEITLFLQWWSKRFDLHDGILQAAIAGFWFVTINPYDDGNGRLARAITDMALARDEKLATRFYSLSAQIIEERQGYSQILEKSQKGGLDITNWLHWFLGCFERAIGRSDELVGKVLLKSRFWELHHNKPLTERQQKVVNRLLDAGPNGFKGGLTTRKYVGMTKASRATSYREIADLINKKMLKQNPGKGRSVSYTLVWPE
jgi:Fic family protein